MSSKSKKIPPWSELPQELLTTIATFLISNTIDVLSFRSVCKSWFLSSHFTPSSLFPPFPLKIPSLPFTLTNTIMHDPPVLSCTAVYTLRPPNLQDVSLPSMSRDFWVVFLDQITPGKVSIRQPFARNSYSLPLNFPKCINLLDFHAHELCHFYNISCLDYSKGKPFSWFGALLKVVVVRNVGVVVLSKDGNLGLLRFELGLAKPGCNYAEVGSTKGRMYADLDSPMNLENVAENSKWEVIHNGKGYRFDDIVEFRGGLLGIDRRGRVYEIDIGLVSVSPVSIKGIVPSVGGGGGRRKRLVVSLGKLYLIVRNKVKEEGDALFKVYELNEDTKKWMKVNSLGNRTFFVGFEFSFSMSSEEFHGSCEKNCILFNEQSFLKYNGSDDDYFVFKNLGRGDLKVVVWDMEDAAHIDLVRTHPGQSNALWPPPNWIWPMDMDERVKTILTALDELNLRIPHEKLEAKLKELSGPQKELAFSLIKNLVSTIMEFQLIVKLTEDKLKQFGTLNVKIMSMQQKILSSDLENQVGTSTQGDEEWRVSFAAMKKMLSDCYWDLYSMARNLNKEIIEHEERVDNLESTIRPISFSTFLDGIC